jgi:hypothetical protein
LNEEEKKIRIAWSKCENIITATHADVLVIFDCCEAGSVGGYKSRARRPNFEYITACGEGDYTGIPGEKSFTSALIWSLNELCDQAPFTSDQLVKKTREYPHLGIKSRSFDTKKSQANLYGSHRLELMPNRGFMRKAYIAIPTTGSSTCASYITSL